jgi:hypothetical protein
LNLIERLRRASGIDGVFRAAAMRERRADI